MLQYLTHLLSMLHWFYPTFPMRPTFINVLWRWKGKNIAVIIIIFASWLQMTNQLCHWLQKTQLTIESFASMFNMLITYFSRIKLAFLLPWGLHGLFGDNFAQFEFKFELIQPLLAPNHFACPFNVLQGLQSLLTVTFQYLKGLKTLLPYFN
jgi:chromate transport protein ChrA